MAFPLDEKLSNTDHERLNVRVSRHTIRVLTHIHDHYSKASVSQASVAKLIGVSSAHLCRVLKRDTGHTFASCRIDVDFRWLVDCSSITR